jgi:type III secretory pathway component EscS
MKYFADADPGAFTRELSTSYAVQTPFKEAQGDIQGYYFFRVENISTDLRNDGSVATWERVVGSLSRYPAFQGELFYWTVLGIQSVTDKEQFADAFSCWPDNVDGGKTYYLLVYQYHPSQDFSVEKRPSLSISTGEVLRPIGPTELIIDSPYDVRRWNFQAVESTLRQQPTWLRVGPTDGWTIDLNLAVPRSLLRPLLTTAVAGILIAGPSILTMLQQPLLTFHWKLAAIFAALLFGWFAAAAIIFRVRRID